MRRYPDAFKKAHFNILSVFKIPREDKDPISITCRKSTALLNPKESAACSR